MARYPVAGVVSQPTAEDVKIAGLLLAVRKNNKLDRLFGRVFHVIKDYWPLGRYMLQKFGWRSFYSFWWTKLFVCDEGGELALLHPFHRRWPWLLRRPFKLEMEHTTICNKKCICCEHTHWDEKQEQITIDYFKNTVSAVPTLKWMNVTGEGSTFLNKNFIPILRYLREERHINTNFVDEMDFLDEEKARLLVGLGINSVWVSFDGASKKVYEDMKEGCSYDKAVHNIKTLIRVRDEMGSPFPVIDLRYVISRRNYHEMADFIDLVASFGNLGVRGRVEFVGLLTFPGIEQYYIPFEEIPHEIITKALEKALEKNIYLFFSHAKTELPPIEYCAAWAEPYVLIGGEVISCCAIVMSNRRKTLRDNSFGNVKQQPFLEIWKSERYQKFRRQVVNRNAPVPGTCYACRAFDTSKRAERCGVDPLVVLDDQGKVIETFDPRTRRE